MEINFSKKFYRKFDKYLKKHPHEALLIRNRINLLKTFPTHPSLRLHKLENRENEYAISIDHSTRLVFTREKDSIFLLDIGSHDEVY